jgi:hypothetical protein
MKSISKLKAINQASKETPVGTESLKQPSREPGVRQKKKFRPRFGGFRETNSTSELSV